MTKSETTVVQVKQLGKNYKDITALSGVSFTINKGEIFGYIGPNGAGKTTTLKILVGLITDYSGEVMIENKELKEHPNPSKLIGYLPQDVDFQEWRTVNQALTTFGLLSEMTREQLQEKIPEVLEIVGLTEVRHKKIKHLSGGMKQKLKLAQAILHNPPILVFDEPLSGLDPTSRWQMKQIIRKLAETNVTIIFSSHILEDVEGIASTIGILHQGSIAKIGSPKELQQEIDEGNVVEVIGPGVQTKAAEIEALPFVEEVKTIEKDNKIRIQFQQDLAVEECVIQLMTFFSKNRIPVWNFNTLRPTLERVYLKYVAGGEQSA